jgi:hypothetical protein
VDLVPEAVARFRFPSIAMPDYWMQARYRRRRKPSFRRRRLGRQHSIMHGMRQLSTRYAVCPLAREARNSIRRYDEHVLKKRMKFALF